MWKMDQKKYEEKISAALIYQTAGKITKSLGLVYEAHLPGASIGSRCTIVTNSSSNNSDGVDAEVIGFKDKRVYLMPLEPVYGINNDSLVLLKNLSSTVSLSAALWGRVINAKGEPIDGKGPISLKNSHERNLYETGASPLERPIISEKLDLGLRVLNGITTCGKGQRVGILAGSGVGKSILLGMIARNTQADISVISLVGERGREVREFIERDLGEEGLKRSVIIVSPSDTSPLLRMRCAFLAATVAEYFRDQKKDVLLMMDSVTRFCMAQREIGLSLGEPPATKGYPPSVFSTMPRLFERAGTLTNSGSITGLFTVLVEGDDMDDPIADSARSFLDGHIVLSRKLAEKNHFPAVDVLQSSSRVMPNVSDEHHLKHAGLIREWIASYTSAEDLINIGAYVPGSNQKIDTAVALKDKIDAFLRQDRSERSSMDETLALMSAIVRRAESLQASPETEETQAVPGAENAALRF